MIGSKCLTDIYSDSVQHVPKDVGGAKADAAETRPESQSQSSGVNDSMAEETSANNEAQADTNRDVSKTPHAGISPSIAHNPTGGDAQLEASFEEAPVDELRLFTDSELLLGILDLIDLRRRPHTIFWALRVLSLFVSYGKVCGNLFPTITITQVNTGFLSTL